jgi:hypothetical protein
LLTEVSEELRKFQSDEKNKKSLDNALEKARLAKIKLNSITTPRGITELFSSMLVGSLFMLAVVWFILRLLFFWLFPQGVFYLDLFVISFVGSVASAIIYLGRGSTVRIDSLKAFCNLAASPFVAIILVVIFSELAIGVGGAIAATGTAETEIVSFTLKGASTELKYAFGFMFSFFGEISIELLRSIMSSAAGKE